MKDRIVIKLGGSSLQDPKTLGELAATVKGYRDQNFDVVLVHGGGPAINDELTKRGITWQFINGQRQTTPEMIDVIEEVLAGHVNSMVVKRLREAGLPAMGLSGVRDQILFCSQASSELMCVGQVEKVDTTSVEQVLAHGAIPVIAPVGFGNGGLKYNVNADWAATKIAMALQVKRLIFLTDQDGILDADKKLVRAVTPGIVREMMALDVISGGMRTKVLAMMAALTEGADEVCVLRAAEGSRLHQTHSKFEIGTTLINNITDTDCRKAFMHEHAS